MGLLDRIAARLGRRPLEGEALEHRFRELRDGVEASVPPFLEEAVEPLFRRQAQANLFEWIDAANASTLVATLAAQPLPLALTDQPAVRTLPWGETGASFCGDWRRPVLAVVAAQAGIAESGSVAVNAAAAPSGLLFLAEELLFVLERRHIVRDLEDLNTAATSGALHLISGPSRTADVEQTLQVGAHGPRRVYLWLTPEA